MQPPPAKRLPKMTPTPLYNPIYLTDADVGTNVDTSLQTRASGVRLIVSPPANVLPLFDQTGLALADVVQLYDSNGPPMPFARPLLAWRPTDPMDIERYIAGPFQFSQGIWVQCIPAGATIELILVRGYVAPHANDDALA
jgi:hypothetical protein